MKDSSLKSILIIGSGPIIIGQACEFDYSGSQASRSLREEGIEVTLINSNPATIMTDPVTADNVYLMPLTPDSIEFILRERHIDAVLPTMGGQTALNLALECETLGIWEKYDVKMIGVDVQAIERAQVGVLVLDASQPIATQDQRVGGEIQKAGIASVVRRRGTNGVAWICAKSAPSPNESVANNTKIVTDVL